jgi:hypothetical protein
MNSAEKPEAAEIRQPQLKQWVEPKLTASDLRDIVKSTPSTLQESALITAAS